MTKNISFCIFAVDGKIQIKALKTGTWNVFESGIGSVELFNESDYNTLLTQKVLKLIF